jgi:hypothetical protein
MERNCQFDDDNRGPYFTGRQRLPNGEHKTYSPFYNPSYRLSDRVSCEDGCGLKPDGCDRHLENFLNVIGVMLCLCIIPVIFLVISVICGSTCVTSPSDDNDDDDDAADGAAQRMERGGEDEILSLLKAIHQDRQGQSASFLKPKGGGYLTQIPIVGTCIGMIPLVDKIPLLGPMLFGKAAPNPNPSGKLTGTYEPWNEGGCRSGKLFGASGCGIAFKKPHPNLQCDCCPCSMPVLCNGELKGVGFDCSLCDPWPGVCSRWTPSGALTCCHISMRIPVFHLFAWNPGCMCCMEGCEGIQISWLPSCFKALYCGHYEDIDGDANHKPDHLRGTVNEPPIANTAVEAAIEAQA